MIDPQRLVRSLREMGVDLFVGVPDSLMEPFCTCIAATLPGSQHIVAANEGGAIGIAIGHHLSRGLTPVVYLQNAGIGNTVNPLVSLSDPEVYGIPMLVMVGWRGQPGTVDEPQHMKQGKIMTPLIESLELPWTTLPHDPDDAEKCLREAKGIAESRSCPYVILVEKGTFSPFAKESDRGDEELPSREEALVALVEKVGNEAAFVATTGMLGRELYEYRQRTGQPGGRDFLTVGGMGHCSSVALGVAMGNADREVWCLDGDGSVLMHLGGLAVIGEKAPANLYHVVFNNGVHDSVGGQPTSINVVDLPAVARALGYRYSSAASNEASLAEQIGKMRAHGGPALLDLRVRPGNRPGIGRPERSPREAKEDFMSSLT